MNVRIVETGEEFKSIAECARYLNASATMISYCTNEGLTFKGLHIERIKK